MIKLMDNGEQLLESALNVICGQLEMTERNAIRLDEATMRDVHALRRVTRMQAKQTRRMSALIPSEGC